MLYPCDLFVHVLLARFGDGLGSPEVPAVGESGTSRERGFADGATESATWLPVKSGGENHWGETEIRRRHWMFHKKQGDGPMG